MKRLVVVAEDSLIVEAIGIALRRSGEFDLVAHLDGRSASAAEIVAASPEVVLIDEMEQSEDPITLIGEIKAVRETVTVIVLTLSPEAARLDEMFDAAQARRCLRRHTQPR